MKTHFSLSDFDFALPEELIAQQPAAQRSGSRLLDGRDSAAVDRRFTDLPGLLNPGDLLVFNDTQVVKARLFGQKSSGGRLELLIERVLPALADASHEVAAHMKVSKSPNPAPCCRWTAASPPPCWAAGRRRTGRCTAFDSAAPPMR
ncbi:S-adenosylmethionine:tRNA ribosyltransferase-isomerase [Polaromonas sp. P1(28)-8]|nr:S-adenosylmethionine:tRNA ribosyltransferase-isomerase [Polaromonas sp. P1(28)-8]